VKVLAGFSRNLIDLDVLLFFVFLKNEPPLLKRKRWNIIFSFYLFYENNFIICL